MTNKTDDFRCWSNSHSDRPAFPENLDSLSAVELAEQLEQYLNTVTEYTCDEAVVDAYLEAMDHRVPMPDMKSADKAYAEFLEYLHDSQKKSLHTGDTISPNGDQ